MSLFVDRHLKDIKEKNSFRKYNLGEKYGY